MQILKNYISFYTILHIIFVDWQKLESVGKDVGKFYPNW